MLFYQRIFHIPPLSRYHPYWGKPCYAISNHINHSHVNFPKIFLVVVMLVSLVVLHKLIQRYIIVATIPLAIVFQKKMLIYSYVNCVILVLSVGFLNHLKHHSYINHCILPRFHLWPDAATHQGGAERGRVTWVRCPASAASRPALQPDARGFAQQWNLQ